MWCKGCKKSMEFRENLFAINFFANGLGRSADIEDTIFFCFDCFKKIAGKKFLRQFGSLKERAGGME